MNNKQFLEIVAKQANSVSKRKYIPDTIISVLNETKVYDDQLHYALLPSWQIAPELALKIAQLGFKGGFIVPLLFPQILENPLK
jgi:hypothetical protein